MPEEIEVDTDRLREEIDREVEAVGSKLLRSIALTTAILAALAAVASLRAGATVNEALVLKNEATTLQAQASDQWAYYQAKGIKSAVAQSSAELLKKLNPTRVLAYQEEATRYTAQQDSISRMARAIENRRDERAREASTLLEQHHVYAASVAVLQIAIALGAIAALTRSRLVWLGSVGAGIIGGILFALGFVRK
jgi:Domain of unknown function (DUF4337)